MSFTVIDRENWTRKEYFEHYLTIVPCTYSMTTKLDITAIKKKGLRLYPTMLYLLTRTVNQYEQFRMAFRKDGQLVMYDEMSPCYTIFHKETETFSNIWTEYSDDYSLFCQHYEKDISEFGCIKKLFAKPGLPDNSFTVSMIPWQTFDGFHLNTKNFDYLLPIFTIGKYYIEHAHCYIPLAVQVHHSVCDGFHLCAFLDDLQKQILLF